MPEPEDEEPGASDELVAALAGGAALTFEPDVDEDDDLLPGDRAARVAERPRSKPPSRGHPGGHRRGARARGGREGRGRHGGGARPDGRADRVRPDRATDGPTPRGMRRSGTPTAQERRHRWRTSRRSWSRNCASGPAPGSWIARRPSTETDGDLEKATALLRERGVAQAAKKAGRDAREGLIGTLHPHRRPVRRAHRGQLRDRLRRPQRAVPAARQGPRHPGRRPARRDYPSIESIPADVLAAKKAELLADEIGPEEAREYPRADRRRPAQEVVSAGRADRAALPRHGPDGRPADHERHRDDRREHPGPALRAVRGRGGTVTDAATTTATDRAGAAALSPHPAQAVRRGAPGRPRLRRRPRRLRVHRRAGRESSTASASRSASSSAAATSSAASPPRRAAWTARPATTSACSPPS